MIDMSIARQLFQLQEIDLEIDSTERALNEKVSQLGESPAVAKARAELASEQKRLEELKHQQRSLEWEIDDIGGKLRAVEDKLYGGRVSSPKELTSLQHEAEVIKASRSRLEDKVLDIMGQVEALTERISILTRVYKELEAECQRQQGQLAAEIESLKLKLSDLRAKQQAISATIDSGMVEFYRRLREQKGMAVARVEQGRCLGCRILLATTELQRARSGLVQCSSCGRILYVA